MWCSVLLLAVYTSLMKLYVFEWRLLVGFAQIILSGSLPLTLWALVTPLSRTCGLVYPTRRAACLVSLLWEMICACQAWYSCANCNEFDSISWRGVGGLHCLLNLSPCCWWHYVVLDGEEMAARAARAGSRHCLLWDWHRLYRRIDWIFLLYCLRLCQFILIFCLHHNRSQCVYYIFQITVHTYFLFIEFFM